MLRKFYAIRYFFGVTMLLAFPLFQQGIAQEMGENTVPTATWNPPQPEKPTVVKQKVDQPVKVRIGLRLTPFKKISTRNKDNSLSQRFIPMEPLRHTLRARLNKTNHFFIGEWHIETKPLTFIKKTMRYAVRLTLYRRYGAFGQLEEKTGSVDLSGVLDEGENNVHVLLGVARERLRNKFGNPVLDVVAGFAPGTKPNATISADEHLSGRAAAPAQPPKNYSGSLIRGRF